MKFCTIVLSCFLTMSAFSRAGIGVGLPIDSDPVRDCVSDFKDYYAASNLYYKFSLQPEHQLPTRVFFLQISQYPDQSIPLKTLEITGMALWGDVDVAFVLTRIFKDNQQYCKDGLLHLKERYHVEIKQKAGSMYTSVASIPKECASESRDGCKPSLSFKQNLQIAYTYLHMYWGSMRSEERVMLARWWLLYPATQELPPSLSNFDLLKRHHKNIKELLGHEYKTHRRDTWSRNGDNE